MWLQSCGGSGVMKLWQFGETVFCVVRSCAQSGQLVRNIRSVSLVSLKVISCFNMLKLTGMTVSNALFNQGVSSSSSGKSLRTRVT